MIMRRLTQDTCWLQAKDFSARSGFAAFFALLSLFLLAKDGLGSEDTQIVSPPSSSEATEFIGRQDRPSNQQPGQQPRDPDSETVFSSPPEENTYQITRQITNEQDDSTKVVTDTHLSISPKAASKTQSVPKTISFSSTIGDSKKTGTLTARLGQGVSANVYRVDFQDSTFSTQTATEQSSTTAEDEHGFAIKLYKTSTNDDDLSELRDNEKSMVERIMQLQRDNPDQQATLKFYDLGTVRIDQDQGQDESAIIMELARATLNTLIRPDVFSPKTFIETYDSKDPADLIESVAFTLPLLQIEALIEFIVRMETKIGWLRKHDIIHGDLKLGNLILTKANRIVISDFGTSRTVGTKLGFLGTTPFIAAPNTYLVKVEGLWIDFSEFMRAKSGLTIAPPSEVSLKALASETGSDPEVLSAPYRLGEATTLSARQGLAKADEQKLSIKSFFEMPVPAYADTYALGRIVLTLLLDYTSRIDSLKPDLLDPISRRYQSILIDLTQSETTENTKIQQVNPVVKAFDKASARLSSLLSALLNASSKNYFEELKAVIDTDYLYFTSNPLDQLLSCQLQFQR